MGQGLGGSEQGPRLYAATSVSRHPDADRPWVRGAAQPTTVLPNRRPKLRSQGEMLWERIIL